MANTSRNISATNFFSGLVVWIRDTRCFCHGFFAEVMLHMSSIPRRIRKVNSSWLGEVQLSDLARLEGEHLVNASGKLDHVMSITIWLWLTVSHGFSMALIEIDGLPFLIAWWIFPWRPVRHNQMVMKWVKETKHLGLAGWWWMNGGCWMLDGMMTHVQIFPRIC